MITRCLSRGALTKIVILLIQAPPIAAVEAMQVEPIGGWELAKVSGGLFLVIAAIVVTAAILKRLKSLHATHGSDIKIVDAVSVSTRDRIVLIEVDKQRVLVGVSPGRIQALHVFATAPADQSSFVDMVECVEAPLRDGRAP